MDVSAHEMFLFNLFKDFAALPFVDVTKLEKLEKERGDWLRWVKKYELDDLRRAQQHWERSKEKYKDIPSRAEFCGWVEKYKVPLFTKPKEKRVVTHTTVELINGIRAQLGLPQHEPEAYLTDANKAVE